MAARLKYDLDSLGNLSQTIGSLSQELSELHTTIQEQMKQLRQDWDTPAGRKFFETQNTDWSAEVKNYVKILSTLKDMIDYAIGQYDNLKTDAEKISVQ